MYSVIPCRGIAHHMCSGSLVGGQYHFKLSSFSFVQYHDLLVTMIHSAAWSCYRAKLGKKKSMYGVWQTGGCCAQVQTIDNRFSLSQASAVHNINSTIWSCHPKQLTYAPYVIYQERPLWSLIVHKQWSFKVQTTQIFYGFHKGS